MSTGTAADRLITVFKGHNEIVTAAFLCRFHDFFIGRALSAHADVIHNTFIKEIIFLRDIRHIFVILRKRHILDVHAADRNRTGIHIPERSDQSCNGRFTGTRRADQRIDCTVCDLYIDAVQYLRILIRKANILQRNPVSVRYAFANLRAHQILFIHHIRHIADDLTYPRHIIRIAEHGHKWCDCAERQDDQHDQISRRKAPVQAIEHAGRK